MKKVFSYLLVIALVFGMGISFVNAEEYGHESFDGSGDTGAEVTVGDVDVPVYDVEVNWYNFVFDWKYYETTHEYGWMVHQNLDCNAYTFQEIVYDDRFGVPFYTDAACSQPVNLEITSNYEQEDVFYTLEGVGDALASITIEDMSTNGYIEPTLTWNAEDKYDFTTVIITYFVDTPVCDVVDSYYYDEVTEAYTNSNCTGDKIETATAPAQTVFYEYLNDFQEVEYTGGEIPTTAKRSAAGGILYYPSYDFYDLHLKLGVDTTKTVTTPTAGDTIGTLTITITAH